MNILGVDSDYQNNGTWSNVENMLNDGWEDRQRSLNSGNLNTKNSIFYLLSAILLGYLFY